jgi:hypothetical protein
MDTTLQEPNESGYEDFLSWTDPPRKGMQFTFNDSLLFNSLEESARATAQAAISAFGVRFEPPAIAELYRLIEEGVIQMKLSKEDDDLEKISQAQRNLVDFIGDIVRTCKERALTTVDDKTVREVRKIQLCPVYPFK